MIKVITLQAETIIAVALLVIIVIVKVILIAIATHLNKPNKPKRK